MRKKFHSILLIAVTAVTLFGLSAYSLLKAPETYSLSERRTLAQAPKMTAETLESGRFMSDFETYTLDQFPMRDTFRRLKAEASRHLFHQKDNHGLYLEQGYVSNLEYPMNAAKVERNAKKLRQIYHSLLADSSCTLYQAVIPDKNAFLAPLGDYPLMDYAHFTQTWTGYLDYAQPIDLSETLFLGSFFRTDQHWRQDALYPVANRLAEAMGIELDLTFTEQLLDAPFYGAYCGQAALNLKPDQLYYLTNDVLDSCTVTGYGTGKAKERPMYDMEKAHGRDPYEMFLCGSDPLVVIENPNAETDKELVVFRDSFASTLVPLLVPGYAKITMVDLRYMNSALLGSLVDFQEQDVLFLYSTLVLNNTISQ